MADSVGATAAPMEGASAQLLLFTRQGCCLCEGLEEKLRALNPPPPLQLLDVDADPALQARYGLEVPVLAVELEEASETAQVPGGTGQPPRSWRELPRVPPRLSGDGLVVWLQKNGFPGQHA